MNKHDFASIKHWYRKKRAEYQAIGIWTQFKVVVTTAIIALITLTFTLCTVPY